MSDLTSEKVVAGYMQKAAISLIKKQEFNPNTVEELEAWLCKNSKAIVEDAQNRMEEFSAWLVGDSESGKEAKNLLCKIVYNSIKDSLKNEPVKYNERYLEYCDENGCTPEEMKIRDKGSMVNYICWKPKNN